MEMMLVLPSQVLRSFKAARRRSPIAVTLHAIRQATVELDIYETAINEWSESLDESLRARGAEYVDMSDPAQCAAFVARIDRKAMQKQYVRRLAIAIARLELERLTEAAFARALGS